MDLSSAPDQSYLRNGYNYTELEPDEIRVLVLHPGKRDDPLRGSLEHVSLDDQFRIQYKAISYAWGQLSLVHLLHLDNGCVKITESLHGALRNFRNEETHVVLWADAVCINQLGLMERNHQVNIMARIFHEAEEVLVWLGEALESDRVAFSLIRFIESMVRCNGVNILDVTERIRLEADCNAYLASEFDQSACPCCSQRVEWRTEGYSHALSTLILVWTRPWFQRLWVMQEVARAKVATLIAGPHQTAFTTSVEFTVYLQAKRLQAQLRAYSHGQSWDTLQAKHLQAQLRAYSHGQSWDTTRGALDGVWGIVLLVTRAKSARPLTEALLATRSLRTTEAHDRIFALRSLVSGAEDITPDYSVPLAELWRRVTVAMLPDRTFEDADRSQNVACSSVVLALAGLQDRHYMEGGNSWVPDFEHLSDEMHCKHLEYQHHSRIFRAGGAGPFRPQVDSALSTVLCLRAKILFSISAMCVHSQHPAISSDGHWDYWNDLEHSLISWYLRCWDFVQRARDAHPDLVVDVSELLTHGQMVGERHALDGPSFADCEMLFTKAVSDCENMDPPDPLSMFADLKPFMRQIIWDHLFLDDSRVLARMSNGLLGWIPETSKLGDVICVFEGAPSPFVLSRRSDGLYTLRGDAYVQGIMHGEAWPEDEGQLETIGLI